MEKFTVIVLHYNQPQYIENALKSVLEQDYENIELILADDGSDTFDQKAAESFLNRERKDNLGRFEIVSGAENAGTVRSLNRALEKATGDYILFFAADDALYSTDTLSRLAIGMKEMLPEEGVLTAQSLMYDEHLTELLDKHVDERLAVKLNVQPVKNQFEALTRGCIYAAGATAWKRSLLEEMGRFDEYYTYIEDWPFFLRLAREGHRIRFTSFPALKHRGGGISHHQDNKNRPRHVLKYFDEVLAIHEREIFPYINRLPDSRVIDLLHTYYKMRKDLFEMAGNTDRISAATLIRRNFRVHLKLVLFDWMNEGADILKITAVPLLIALAGFSILLSVSDSLILLIFWGFLAGGLGILWIATLLLRVFYHAYRRFIKKGRLTD